MVDDEHSLIQFNALQIIKNVFSIFENKDGFSVTQHLLIISLFTLLAGSVFQKAVPLTIPSRYACFVLLTVHQRHRCRLENKNKHIRDVYMKHT